MALDARFRTVLNTTLAVGAPALGKVLSDSVSPWAGMIVQNVISATTNHLCNAIFRENTNPRRNLERAIGETTIEHFHDDEHTREAQSAALNIIQTHGPDPKTLADPDANPERIAAELLVRPEVMAQLGSLSETARERCKTIIRAYHHVFHAGPEVQAELENAFRQKVLEVLRDTPQRVLKAEAELQRGIANTLLRVPRYTWKPGQPLSLLLRADRHIVPFDQAREPDLTDLLNWATTPDAFGVRLYAGPGGTGKTRLALEACERLASQHWRTGFLEREASSRAPLELWARFLEQPTPAFMVMDYAETRRDELQTILGAIHDAVLSQPDTPRLRLVLLARARGDWWDALKGTTEKTQLMLSRTYTQERTLYPMPKPTREDSFRLAAHHFSRTLNKPEPSAPHDLNREAFKNTLLLHTLALMAADGQDPNKSGTELEILDDLLEHERRQWRNGLERIGLGGQSSAFLHGIARVLTLVTLGKTLTSEDAPEFLRQDRVFSDQTNAVLESVSDLLHTFSPGDQWIDPVQPDLLGEHLVQRTLQEPNDAEALFRRFFANSSDAENAQALTVLNRLSVRQSVAGSQLLELALGGRLQRLVLQVINVSNETGGFIGKVAGSLFSEIEDADFAEKIYLYIPEKSVSLGDVSLKSSLLVAKSMRERNDLPSLARWLNRISVKYDGLGKLNEALIFAQESVFLYKSLPETEISDRLEFFARALDNMGAILCKINNPMDGLDHFKRALEIRRRNTEIDPVEHKRAIALSLHNIALCYDYLGDSESTINSYNESISIWKSIENTHSGQFDYDIAKSLTNFGAFLREIDKPEEALEYSRQAVEIYRKRIVSESDVFLPEFAGALINLGVGLSKLGRIEEGVKSTKEAASYWRKLSYIQPDAYKQYLAMALDNLGIDLENLGRNDEAEKSSREAVEIYRELFKSNPDIFQAYFATSLHNFSSKLHANGNINGAFQASNEALLHVTPLFLSHPRKYLSWTKQIAQRYIHFAQEAEFELDSKLLTPIFEKLKELGVVLEKSSYDLRQ